MRQIRELIGDEYSFEILFMALIRTIGHFIFSNMIMSLDLEPGAKEEFQFFIMKGFDLILMLILAKNFIDIYRDQRVLPEDEGQPFIQLNH